MMTTELAFEPDRRGTNTGELWIGSTEPWRRRVAPPANGSAAAASSSAATAADSRETATMLGNIDAAGAKTDGVSRKKTRRPARCRARSAPAAKKRRNGARIPSCAGVDREPPARRDRVDDG